MDDDAFPNFSNAYPAAVTPASESASWNPALRPDSVDINASAVKTEFGDENDDFFERYPSATPKKDQPVPAQPLDLTQATRESSHELEDERRDGEFGAQEDIESPVRDRKQSITVQHVFDVQEESVSLEDSRQLPMFSAKAEGPLGDVGRGSGMADDADDEEAVFHPGDSAQEQEKHLHEALPDTEATQDLESEPVQQKDHASLDQAWEGNPEPAEYYEHQGEATELDKAQVEDEAMPLMDDEAPPPTPGTMSRAHTMGTHISKELQDHDKSPPALDRAFTTNFTEPWSEQTIDNDVQAQSRNAAWPAAGDDATFGQLLEQPQLQESSYERPEAPSSKARQRSDTAFLSSEVDTAISSTALQSEDFSLSEPVHMNESSPFKDDHSGGSGQDDIAAAFAAALDADDLLEDDDILLEEDEEEEVDTHVEGENLAGTKAFFGDDDELLEDDFLAGEAGIQSQLSRAALGNLHDPIHGPERQRPQPTHADSFHGRSAGTPDTGLFDILNEPGSLQQQSQPARPASQTAQSFADKAKGGYQSPYDLPMEVLKPKRPRAQPSAQSMNSQQPTPPPRRSSSFASQASQQQPASQGASAAQRRAPSISSVGSTTSQPTQTQNGATSSRAAVNTDAGFFADLPVAPKPRARASYTTQQQSATAPPVHMPPRAPSNSAAPAVQALRASGLSSSAENAMQQQVSAIMGGLRQPEKPPMFPDQVSQHQQASSTSTGPPVNTRYSPALHRQASQTMPPVPITQNRVSPVPPGPARSASKTRYSPAPAPVPAATGHHPGTTTLESPPQGPAMVSGTMSSSSVPATLSKRPSQQYAPRTSSPLAYATNHSLPNAGVERELPATPPRVSPPHSLGGLTNMSMSPPERSLPNKYAPASKAADTTRESNIGPVVNQRIHSPDRAARGPNFSTAQVDRSSLVGQTTLPTFPAQQPQGAKAALPHRRQFSKDLTFATPSDERGQDPLQRWRGRPIFTWDASGKVVHSFPKQTPFYASGQMTPSIKCTPGDTTIAEAQQFMPIDERTAKFPGPLPARSKGKKKDVIAWLGSKIEDLERRLEHSTLHFDVSLDAKKRLDEKLILWKLMKLFVEHDGTLEGNPKIQEEVRQILVPNMVQMGQIVDIPSPTSAGVQADVVDKAVLVQLRQALFEGQRERAVWLAEEKRLWGHAMLIASTMGPEVWKQIVQSFVRSNVKVVGSDARSMAALYQIFAGNADECVDELVPPSARAGFQMISKTDGIASANPLEGLDQWRETLALVSSNRTAQDGLSLVSLGKLLSGYGRVEAAHSCFLFARSFVKHSGADDTDAHFVLLGGNHQSADETIGSQLDTILLTEVYEFACSLSAPSSAMAYVPHLQAYKLMHAQELAACGLKNKAQNYCQHIATAMSASTRGSPYYHANLVESVAGLNGFLSQTPDSGVGLFGKNSLNKMSSGMGSWFNKFVAGEDAETASNASGPSGMSDVGGGASTGPFGGVQANGATISRPDSGMNMYTAMGTGLPTTHAVPSSMQSAQFSSPSKYVPGATVGQPGARSQPVDQSIGGRYAPSTTNSSPYLIQRPSFDSDSGFHPELSSSLGIPSEPIRPGSSRSMSSGRYAPIPSSQGLGLSQAADLRPPSEYGTAAGEAVSRRGSAQSGLSNMSYEPKPVLAEQQGITFGYQYSAMNDHAATLEEPTPTEVDADHPTAGAPQDSVGSGEERPAVQSLEGDREVPTTGYVPPTTTYEPPSYQPYEPNAEEPEQDESQPKKKKGIMDDDDDGHGEELARRAAALKKAQADREADEAFRKAAEADAARANSKGDEKKAGWFGGWFGKKDPSLAPGPVRAKLGEQSSFYYDEQLKKWVNKKAGAEAATAATPTPPPPKGGPSRVTGGGPPSGPPSRTGSGTGLAGMAGSRPPTSSGLAGPPSGPPSRAGTPASTNGGSNELAPPGAPNGVASAPPSTAPSMPPSRPGTGLSNASSIDDLLGGGPPGPRKGGTARGKKKGGRYVDVMASK